MGSEEVSDLVPCEEFLGHSDPSPADKFRSSRVKRWYMHKDETGLSVLSFIKFTFEPLALGFVKTSIIGHI